MKTQQHWDTRKEHRVRMEAESGVIYQQAKEHQGLLATTNS